MWQFRHSVLAFSLTAAGVVSAIAQGRYADRTATGSAPSIRTFTDVSDSDIAHDAGPGEPVWSAD